MEAAARAVVRYMLFSNSEKPGVPVRRAGAGGGRGPLQMHLLHLHPHVWCTVLRDWLPGLDQLRGRRGQQKGPGRVPCEETPPCQAAQSWQLW